MVRKIYRDLSALGPYYGVLLPWRTWKLSARVNQVQWMEILTGKYVSCDIWNTSSTVWSCYNSRISLKIPTLLNYAIQVQVQWEPAYKEPIFENQPVCFLYEGAISSNRLKCIIGAETYGSREPSVSAWIAGRACACTCCTCYRCGTPENFSSAIKNADCLTVSGICNLRKFFHWLILFIHWQIRIWLVTRITVKVTKCVGARGTIWWWHRLVALWLVTKTIMMMVHDDVHWSERRILFSVSFDYEGFFPG